MKQPTSIFLKRSIDSHKGNYGHIVIIAGSRTMSGAACLCSYAALRSGAGLVTVATSRSSQPLVALSRPEIITVGLAETSQGTISRQAFPLVQRLIADKADVVALGPGLSTALQTQQFIRHCVRTIDKPLVIDADGLNALAGNLESLQKKNRVTVITPHPGELSRLLRIPVADIQKQRAILAKTLARRYNTIAVIKGYGTIVADPCGRVFRNTTGNPGMATAGSGDVLTGIIAALLAQAADPFAAVTTAVYVHGLAGDLAVRGKGLTSLVASDIIEALPRAFRQVSGKRAS